MYKNITNIVSKDKERNEKYTSVVSHLYSLINKVIGEEGGRFRKLKQEGEGNAKKEDNLITIEVSAAEDEEDDSPRSEFNQTFESLRDMHMKVLKAVSILNKKQLYGSEGSSAPPSMPWL